MTPTDITGSQEVHNPALVGRAVLGQVVLDMQLDPSLRFPGETIRRTTEWWNDGLRWVLDDTPAERGFVFWCSVYGQPPRVVRAKILAKLAEKNSDWAWRAVAKIAEKLTQEITAEKDSAVQDAA